MIDIDIFSDWFWFAKHGMSDATIAELVKICRINDCETFNGRAMVRVTGSKSDLYRCLYVISTAYNICLR